MFVGILENRDKCKNETKNNTKLFDYGLFMPVFFVWAFLYKQVFIRHVYSTVGLSYLMKIHKISHLLIHKYPIYQIRKVYKKKVDKQQISEVKIYLLKRSVFIYSLILTGKVRKKKVDEQSISEIVSSVDNELRLKNNNQDPRLNKDENNKEPLNKDPRLNRGVDPRLNNKSTMRKDEINKQNIMKVCYFLCLCSIIAFFIQKSALSTC